MKHLIYSVFTVLCVVFFVSCKGRNDEQAELQGKRNEVERMKEYLLLNPDSAGLRLIIANKLDSVGEYKNALLQMDTLLAADSSKYGLWVAKANILADSGNTNEAKKMFQKAVAVFPGNEAVLGFSEILANEKNDSCLIVAKQFEGIQNAYYNYVSALYFYNTDSLAKADSLLEKCFAEDTYFTKPYLLKGKILLKNNRPQNAINIFTEGLKIEPKNIALLNNLAEAYVQIKQADSAKVYFAKSLVWQPFQPKVSEEIKSL